MLLSNVTLTDAASQRPLSERRTNGALRGDMVARGGPEGEAGYPAAQRPGLGHACEQVNGRGRGKKGPGGRPEERMLEERGQEVQGRDDEGVDPTGKRRSGLGGP